MTISSQLKSLIPPLIRPYLRRAKRFVLRGQQTSKTYVDRVRSEIDIYSATEQVHDLPAIAHYWSNKHLIPVLEPLGFKNSIELFRGYIAQVCRRNPADTCAILSVGAGDSASEINIAQWLFENEIRNFQFNCLDINQEVLDRGKKGAATHGVADAFTFNVFDVNTWIPQQQFDIIVAFQSLHHFIELELLFDKIHGALHPEGFFLTDDMIGRNGHRRWPEALKFVRNFWEELPDSYKYHHGLKQHEQRFINRDYSADSFEGIRAQDILPLLLERFHFDLFVGFSNIVDIFVDRAFGPNFDPARQWDREFIDRVHGVDVREIEAGRVKPTHIYAAMTKTPVRNPRFHKHLTAQFCVRRPKRSFISRFKRTG